MADCRHCGLPVTASPTAVGSEFCCPGCAGAYHLIEKLGLSSYYQRRTLDPDAAPLKPDSDDMASLDYGAAVRENPASSGEFSLFLMVEGLHCAACVWLIETVLSRQPGVLKARVNMTTRRLELRWRGEAETANTLIAQVSALGYRLAPYDPARLGDETQRQEKELLRAMAVAGFAAGNVMLLSVSIWAGYDQGMGPQTRELMHWLSALIALPAVAYAGTPFFRSALGALRVRRVNMDVPISLAVLLASAMSLHETVVGGLYAYFDSAVMLLFFLLVGRYLDRRARGRARAAAEHLLTLNATAATVLDADGSRRLVSPEQVEPGMTVLVAVGERVAVDGVVSEGQSDLDTSLITGETTPTRAAPGEPVFAGVLNLSAPLRLIVSAAGEATLLAEIVRLMEDAEQGRARYVALADRLARFYAPVVHSLALVAFLGWWLVLGVAWQQALLIAISVLIITCPCALALAAPAVQVIASGRLLRQGVLVKSGEALERLSQVSVMVFDKTGTLTEGRPVPDLAGLTDQDRGDLAALAGVSKHPLARALSRALPGYPVASAVHESPGNGLSWHGPSGEIRLGRRAWACGEDDGTTSQPPVGDTALGPELWLTRPQRPPLRIGFADTLRHDAVVTIDQLRRRGLRLMLLSGDRQPVVAAVAQQLGIDHWQAQLTPADKAEQLCQLAQQGQRVAMVGDGLNDAPALALAHVSLSPTSAVDVAQTAADLVFQGHLLAPVAEAHGVASQADRLVKQNFAAALLYNAIAIPVAMAGWVTPLLAAVAMSTSSLVVIANALRLVGRRRKT